MFNLGTELCLICCMDYCTVSVEEMASKDATFSRAEVQFDYCGVTLSRHNINAYTSSKHPAFLSINIVNKLFFTLISGCVFCCNLCLYVYYFC